MAKPSADGVDIDATNIYAETDLELNAKALGLCAVKSNRHRNAGVTIPI
jgi:hypothetical protein